MQNLGPEGQKPLIAVIEDDTAIGELIGQTLAQSGFNTIWLDRGEKLIDLIQARKAPEERPSVIYLDHYLSTEMDGMRTAELVRQSEASDHAAGLSLPRIPIVLMSAGKNPLIGGKFAMIFCPNLLILKQLKLKPSLFSNFPSQEWFCKILLLANVA